MMCLNHDMQLSMSDVLNFTQLAGVATSVWTMDAFGRRPTAADWFCLHDRFAYDHCFIGDKVRQGLAYPIGQLGGLA